MKLSILMPIMYYIFCRSQEKYDLHICFEKVCNVMLKYEFESQGKFHFFMRRAREKPLPTISSDLL